MILKYDSVRDEEKGKLPYLDNILNIIDEKECEKVERKLSACRAVELLESKKLQKLPLDEKTLKYIHKTLFQDIYPWAGTFRSCNITKGRSTFFNVDFLDYGLKEFFCNLQKDDFLQGLTRTEFVDLFSYYSNELNFLHPFREGNGRTKKIFMSELAKRAGFEVDYSKITHSQLRSAEIAAFGVYNDDGTIMRSMYQLKKIYNDNIVSIKDISAPQTKTIEELINRLLWIYDRESQVNWMSNHASKLDGEKDVKSLLQTKDGREKLKTYLGCAKSGVKPQKVVNLIDEIILKLNCIEKPKNQDLEY